MKILGIDTSAKTASVSLSDGDRLISEAFVNVGLTHSETLMPMVDSVLKNAKQSIGDVERLVVTVGPGSFTGIRIGVAAVKGLAQNSKILCAGISTLEAMAYTAMDTEGIVCCAMDARCGQVYTAVFEIHKKVVKRLTEDIAISLDALYNILKGYNAPVLLTGDGAEICYNTFADKLPGVALAGELLRYQRAYGAVLASLQKDISVFEEPAMLAPVYLRPPQAERELKKKREENNK